MNKIILNICNSKWQCFALARQQYPNARIIFESNMDEAIYGHLNNCLPASCDDCILFSLFSNALFVLLGFSNSFSNASITKEDVDAALSVICSLAGYTIEDALKILTISSTTLPTNTIDILNICLDLTNKLVPNSSTYLPKLIVKIESELNNSNIKSFFGIMGVIKKCTLLEDINNTIIVICGAYTNNSFDLDAIVDRNNVIFYHYNNEVSYTANYIKQLNNVKINEHKTLFPETTNVPRFGSLSGHKFALFATGLKELVNKPFNFYLKFFLHLKNNTSTKNLHKYTTLMPNNFAHINFGNAMHKIAEELTNSIQSSSVDVFKVVKKVAPLYDLSFVEETRLLYTANTLYNFLKSLRAGGFELFPEHCACTEFLEYRTDLFAIKKDSQKIIIGDYKTSKSSFKPEEEDGRKVQMSVALLCAEQYLKNGYDIKLQYIVPSKLNEELHFYDCQLTLEQVKKEVENVFSKYFINNLPCFYIETSWAPTEADIYSHLVARGNAIIAI